MLDQETTVLLAAVEILPASFPLPARQDALLRAAILAGKIGLDGLIVSSLERRNKDVESFLAFMLPLLKGQYPDMVFGISLPQTTNAYALRVASQSEAHVIFCPHVLVGSDEGDDPFSDKARAANIVVMAGNHYANMEDSSYGNIFSNGCRQHKKGFIPTMFMADEIDFVQFVRVVGIEPELPWAAVGWLAPDLARQAAGYAHAILLLNERQCPFDCLSFDEDAARIKQVVDAVRQASGSVFTA